MAGSISWYQKGPLIFYNDENDPPTMKPIKQEPKPRRSRYQTEEKYQERVRDWESRKPHDPEIKPKGNSMTNKYYTEKLLPGLLKIINEHKAAGRMAILQEDNDPSHGTKGKCDNLSKSFKK